jgi:hypothetical protein
MSRSRRILLLTLTGIAAALFLVFFNRPTPAGASLWPSLPYQSEDEWIVSQTARAVVDLAQFARASAPASLDQLTISRIATSRLPPRLTLRVGKRDAAIDLKISVWDPDAYVPLARSAGAPEPGPAAAANDDVVAELLNFTSQAFQAQNDAVSAALQADFRNPANHEAAAFLLAALALREAAGQFSDSRLLLCQATAHLAMARAMSGSSTRPSMNGQLADVTLQVIAGRTGPAVMQMDALDGADVAVPAQAWIRALRRRATLDWRVPIADGAPLLERLEYMRTLARMLTENASLEYLETHNPEPVPDWGWRTLDFPITVANGAVFVKDTLERTRSEAALLLNGPRGAVRPKAAAVPSREPQISSVDRIANGAIRVIDEGTWRANYARIAAYSLTSMKKFAYMDADPVASLRRVCDVSRDDCGLLGDWLVSRDRFPEAAKAFEQYIRQGRDRVGVSNSIEWLVRYYQGSKRDADARRVAELAADVGSGRGLRALAGFHYRRREYDRAAELYRQIYRRYDDGTDLLAFFLRRADAAGAAAADPEYAVLLKRYFGGELESVPSGSLSGIPARGLYVKSTTWWTEKAGVRKGDIIVAVDGVRVRTLDQSAVLYERSFDAPLKYTVWRGDRYRDIEGSFRQHYYGVDVEPYANRSK